MEVNVIGELRGNPGNPGFDPTPRVQQFNLQNWARKTDRRHCPAVERVGGFNKRIGYLSNHSVSGDGV